MRGVEIPGLPRALVRDAWWMAPDGASGVGASGVGGGGEVGPQAWVLPGAALAGAVVLVALADALLWSVARPGLSVAVFAVAVALAAVLVRRRVPRRAGLVALAGLLAGLAPLVEQVQALSLVFGLLGLMWALVWLALGAGGSWADVLRGMARLPLAGLSVVFADTLGAGRATLTLRPEGRGLLALVQGWGLSLGLGAVFAGLLVMGNPILDGWLIEAARLMTGAEVNPDRVVFWGLMAVLVWPALRLGALGLSGAPLGLTVPVPGFGLVTPLSVIRALVLFNGLFAVQTLTDAAYLWGGVRLPEGLSYAAYAHRGAYPLLATALLAGAFALMTQRFWPGRPILRGLLALWVVQNVALVASSALRLELYVEVYGLTRLRFAAFVWMGLVAAGLALMLVQMGRGKAMPWFLVRAFGLASVVLYGLCFFNLDGYVARHNLAHTGPALDNYYLCGLSEGAAPALAAHLAAGLPVPCPPPRVHTPADWREWGYRNMRLRHSLAAVRNGPVVQRPELLGPEVQRPELSRGDAL